MVAREIRDRFKTYIMNDDQKANSEAIRNLAIELACLINGSTVDSREKSIALTKLEEVLMWTNKAISRNG